MTTRYRQQQITRKNLRSKIRRTLLSNPLTATRLRKMLKTARGERKVVVRRLLAKKLLQG